MNMGFDVIEALESSVLMSTFVLLSFAILISTVLLLARRAFDERTAEVEGAKELLGVHFAAIDTIVDDPAVSDDLKDLIVSFSKSVTKKEFALACAQQVASEELPIPSEVSARMAEAAVELKELGGHRPDLRDAFTKAVLTGFTSMTLRWPSTRDAVVKLHVANTLRKPLKSSSKETLLAENGLNETIDLASRVFAAKSSGANMACAA
jgi:hypothetical protein